jgi:hypothetical protein
VGACEPRDRNIQNDLRRRSLEQAVPQAVVLDGLVHGEWREIGVVEDLGLLFGSRRTNCKR